MSSTRWTKREEEILKEFFVNEEWEQFLKRLPKRTEKQILMKADRMGLKREDELIEIYYDEERSAWVESTKSYSIDRIWRTNFVYRCSKDIPFAKVKEQVIRNMQKGFYDRFVKAEYMKLLRSLEIDRDEELLRFVWDSMLRKSEHEELENKEERLNKVVESIIARKKELDEEKNKKEQRKKKQNE